MPDYEAWEIEFGEWIKGFEPPSVELRTSYMTDMYKVWRNTRQDYWALPPGKRVEIDLEDVLSKAREGIVAKYENIWETQQVMSMVEEGLFPQPYAGYGSEYASWLGKSLSLGERISGIENEIYTLSKMIEWLMIEDVGEQAAKREAWYVTPEIAAGVASPNPYIAKRNELLSQLEILYEERSKVVLYTSIYQVLPIQIQQGQITSLEDVVKHPAFAAYGITIDDPVVRDLYDKTTKAMLSTPEGLISIGDPDINYEDVIALMAVRARAKPIGVAVITVEEILKAITAGPVVPTSPPYPTGEEALEIYKKAGIPDDLAAELEDLSAYTKELEGMWDVILANQELVKAGIEEAKMPQITAWDVLWKAVSSPGLVALSAFGMIYRYWTAPWGGLHYRLWGKKLGALPLVWDEERVQFDRIFEEARKTENYWVALGIAQAETRMGFTNRFIFDWVVDPLTWLGLGIFTKIAKASHIPKLAHWVGIAERGWVKAWDILIFDQIKAAGRHIPRTPLQNARRLAGEDLQSVARYLVKVTGGKHYRQIPMDDARDLLVKARDWALKHPEDFEDMAQAGRTLLRTQGLDESQITGLMKTLKSEVPITKDLVIAVDEAITHISGFGAGKILTRKAAPAQLLRILGVHETKATLRIALKEINRIHKAGILTSDAILRRSKNVPELLTNIYAHTQKVAFDTYGSWAAHHLEMSGRVASSFSKVNWTVMNAWRNTMDRWVVTPLARMYLAFGAYGVGNIGEGYLKPALARVNPFWKHWKVNPTLKGQKTWAGITKPMELEAAIPRIEMAGETPTLLAIQQMSPALRKWRSIVSGGPIGRFLIDLPSKVGVHQRWNYWHRMAMGNLPDEAPEIMRGLTTIVDDAVKGLPDDMLRHLNLSRGELKLMLLENSIAGPTPFRDFVPDMVADRIAKTKVGKDIAMADRIAGGRVAETITKYTQIPNIMQDDIITKAADGRLWRKAGQGIADEVENSRLAMYDYFVHTPEFYQAKYVELAKGILDTPITTKPEFEEALRMLQDMKTFYGDSADDVLRAAAEMEGQMRTRLSVWDYAEWRAKYRDDIYKQLQDYADVAGDSFEQVVVKLKKDVSVTGITPDQRTSIDSLFGAWVDEMRFTKMKTAELREIQRTMFLTKPKRQPELGQWWDDFHNTTAKMWDEWRVGVAPFRNRSLTQDYLTSEALGVAGPPPSIIDAAGRKLTKVDIATLFHGHPSKLPGSLLRIETMTLKPKSQFIMEVRVEAERMARQAGKTVGVMGFTDDAIGEVYDHCLREMYMSPRAASVIEPRLMELASLEQELWHIYHTKGLPAGTAENLEKFIARLADDIEKTPGYLAPRKPKVPDQLSSDFQAAKQRAADKTSKEYFKDWADYTNENVTTAMMRTVYPFWTYELHRMFWIPRASIRTPGVFKAWGSYMDNTEDGYVHIPGTSLEVNPLRGTIFMGGAIRLIRRDYPEFYDRYPGFSETMDYLSRFGFYPAAWLNFLKVFMGTSAQGRPMFGELLPAWVKTPLNAYIAAFPESAPAKLLLDTILPEPYRDYMTMLLANKICQREQLDFNGRTVWDKLKEGIKLTEEEQEIWTRASQEFGFLGAIMEQGGVFRIRTEEQLAAWDAASKLVEEKTGYTPEQQFRIRQWGFRVGDYAQLDALDQAVLGEMDSIKYHSGIFLALMPSSWQEEDRIKAEFWRAIRELDESIRSEGKITISGQEIVGQEQLDRLLKENVINMTAWNRGRASLRERYAIAFEELASTDRYKNVPLTMEDILDEEGNVIRIGFVTEAEERNLLPPIQHPSRELLNLYYSIRLEKKFDLDSGKLLDDWDGYFLKLDAIITTLEGDRQDDFINMITRKMTPLERLMWEITSRYFRPYNRRNEAILATQFTPEEQAVIREYIFASPMRQTELLEVLRPDGSKLVATYRAMVRQTGQNFRMLNPELDAWLLFFDKTDTTLTPQAQELYVQYKTKWGLPL